MARIKGIDLQGNKRGDVGLTRIFGIGRSTAQDILDEAKVGHEVKVNDWTDDQLMAIRNKINEK